MITTSALYKEASQFISQCYKELNQSDQIEARLKSIEIEIQETGFYTHTYEELEHGAKMAWRNSNRCIGRLFWDKLHVLDARQINDESGIEHEILNHIKYATNSGKILPTITVFKANLGTNNTLTIHNHQLIRYAGYETENGIIGDPKSINFTKECERLGWMGNHTNFDILPIVYSLDNNEPKYFKIPNELILEVPIEHPEYDFSSLNAKWYAVPMISEMNLEIGGISYSAAPFNGWYMGTEIGARNFADEFRYNMLPKVATIIGLDTKRNSTLWKDRALVELNIAVLHSYKKNGVSIVDHHSAAQQFLQFEKQEEACGRELTGNWKWLIPPMSPATTHVFHKRYEDTTIKPNFFPK
ncbi:nitric oxide synthase oxygenase [Bacillus sp. AFS017336]|uniref:nitric oxide synthase oxygenase n=1 Tax=Bacillus sp. AFS017336 TaxID=2033489 RepID=UPI000BF13409|nr:nitric oxide synthase oxygenase [Bacillus sp. AFS017336]PEK99631.1 nitric oxide synthase [Bacillus sp. AFS017336]